MKFLRIVASFLLAGVLIQGSQQACLTSVQLASLGFTASANATTSTTVCTDLYANNGGCVDAAQIQAVFTANQNNLYGNANATVNLDNSLVNVAVSLKTLASVLKNLTSTATNTLTNITAKAANATVNATVNATTKASLVKAAIVSGQTTTTSTSATVDVNVINNINKIAANAKAATNQCFQNYQNLVNGVYCYLTSNQASTNVQASTTSTHTTFTVAVDTNTTGAALSACLPVIDAYCTLTYGISISSDVTSSYLIAGSYSGTSGNVNVASSSCTTLRNNYNCTTTACQTAIYNELINNVFSTSIVNFVQSSTFISAQNTYYGNLANATTSISSYFSRRLQYTGNGSNSNGTGTGSVTPTSSSNGQNVASNGKNSGAAATTYNSSAQLFVALCAFLLAFVYA